MILQLDPPLPLLHEPTKRSGLAHFLIDYGVEIDPIWGLVFDDTGEIWWIPNPQVRMMFNWTFGRHPNGGPQSNGGKPKK